MNKMTRGADAGDMDLLVLDGEECIGYSYVGCHKCPGTLEKEPLYEISLKTKKKYTLCNNMHPRSSSDDNPDTARHFQVSKNNDCQMQDLLDSTIAQPDTKELGNLIEALDRYATSFKSKLKVYKENVTAESPHEQEKD